jgi:hypothetical protein
MEKAWKERRHDKLNTLILKSVFCSMEKVFLSKIELK